MWKIVGGLIAAAALAGCSAESGARDAVRASLKDPDSARFGEFSLVEDTDGRGACLSVNAKNSFGGYTGDQIAALAKDDEGNWQVLDIDDLSYEWCERTVRNELEPYNEPALENAVASEQPIATAPTQTTDPTAKPGAVTIIAVDAVWVQIMDGGATLKQGQLSPGERYDLPATATAPRLTTAKPEALKILVGGTQIPAIGEPGRTVSGVSLKSNDLVQ